MLSHIKKDKPAFALEYEFDEERKTIVFKKIHINNGFLNYTKWDIDEFMLNCHSEGIEEFFVPEFLNVLLYEFLSIDWSVE